MFNTILNDAWLNLAEVRLLRRKDSRAAKGLTPYELWRDAPAQFELYQSLQKEESREKLKAKYWASFVVTPADKTMFVGLYCVSCRGLLEQDMPKPHMDGVDLPGSCDIYDFAPQDALNEFIGKLFIKWGPGGRAWVQRSDRQNKEVTELYTEYKEEEFPGFLNFIKPLSKINALPRTWIEALQATKGIYLLTCPKTKEQYVG